MKRQAILDQIRTEPQVDVLIIGGGVNGIGTFRELALNGVKVLLVEKGDFCSGASAGSSHMLHGGIRYLENGEFRLVREALHERNRLLLNAPHYAKPLPTTIPIFKWTSGILNAPLKFLNLLDRPSERGAIVIKAGLIMYDLFTGSEQTMPYHTVEGRKTSLKKYPQLNPEIQFTATYYDAWMPSPERLCMDMLRDAQAASDIAHAVNYLAATDATGDTVILIDELTGKTYPVQPKLVINAAGPWIDFVNKAMTKPTKFIGGTKGSHLILDHPQLHAATGGHEIFFESHDGRIVLIFPYLDRVMVGTTDIRIENPEEAVCTDAEIDYILSLIPKVFPKIEVNRSHIVYTFSGVRPLPSSESSRTGTISRDHSIQTVKAGKGLDFPIHSLVGGKWTSFRAFSEQTADLALNSLNKRRVVDTKELAIGGGKAYPQSPEVLKMWLEVLQSRTGLELSQLERLFERYGTYVKEVAESISAGKDAPLKSIPHYSRREIQFIVKNEQVEHLDDFLMRRSTLAMTGYATEVVISEVASVMGTAFAWKKAEREAEIARCIALLQQKHRMDLYAKASHEGLVDS